MYLRVFKSIRADKKNSLIQIIGLVLGIVTCIFISHYAFFEYSFDRFNKNSDLIYRTQGTEGMLLGSLAKDKLSYVDGYSRLHPCYRGVSVKSNDKTFFENRIYFADGSLFDMFSFPVIKGDAVNALSLRNQMVISESYAKKYFGNEDPVGKTVEVNGSYESNITYTVGAVFKDIPSNSHLRVDMLLSIENILVNKMYTSDNPWQWGNYYTYFKANKKINKNKFTQDLADLANTNGAREHFGKDAEYPIYSLAELHFNGQSNFMDNNHDAWYVNIRILIALIIMVMAWLNFINISIGSAIKNKLELGVKKLLGASSHRLWIELFQHTLFVNAIALIVAVVLFQFINFIFEKMGTPQPSIPVIYIPLFWISIAFFLLFGALLVSLSIHLLLNRQKLITILSKSSETKGVQSPWIWLFVIQFSASIVLIAFALISTKQVNEIMQVDTGMKTNQILAIHNGNFAQNDDVELSRKVFEDAVLTIPGVSYSTSASYIPGGGIASYMPTRLSEKSSNENIKCRMNFIGYNYIPLFQHKLLAGRNFSEEFLTDGSGVIINESLAKAYGFTNASDAIGKEIFWESRSKKLTIIGVMNDFYQQSADMPIEPTLFQLWPGARGYCLLNIETANTKTTIDVVEKLWKKVHPGNAFDYLWIDEHYRNQFQRWIEYSRMVKLFSLVAIFIACIGLYGVSSMLLMKRTKEIGIRKVNGAKISEILTLLNKDFVKWIAIAFVIATPISYYAMHKWLENFAYKTALSWWIFALAGVIAFAIAILTVSWQSWRAASRNPVESLRYE
jgi:putative ABC transport system permease protein